ncbi:hypothetical protein Tco_1177666 [Tanacetum coccineum]
MFSSPRAHPTVHLLLFSGNPLTKDMDGIVIAKPDLDETHTTPSLAKLNLAKPKTNNDVKIKINKELLKELCNNAYDGTEADDAADHIARFLEILDLVKIPDIDPRATAHFCISTLSYRDSGKIKMNDTTKEDGQSYLKFMIWLNSKFKNPGRMNSVTKSALWDFWAKGCDNEALINDLVSSDTKSNK